MAASHKVVGWHCERDSRVCGTDTPPHKGALEIPLPPQGWFTFRNTSSSPTPTSAQKDGGLECCPPWGKNAFTGHTGWWAGQQVLGCNGQVRLQLARVCSLGERIGAGTLHRSYEVFDPCFSTPLPPSLGDGCCPRSFPNSLEDDGLSCSR